MWVGYFDMFLKVMVFLSLFLFVSVSLVWFCDCISFRNFCCSVSVLLIGLFMISLFIIDVDVWLIEQFLLF